MKFLLDTCTFLYFIEDSPQLSSNARIAIVQPKHEIYLSALSAWEISRKWAKGHLKLPGHPSVVIPAARRAAGIEELTLTEEDALLAEKLPALHKDPIDRMIMAQALNRNLTILTPDPLFVSYPVRVSW